MAKQGAGPASCVTSDLAEFAYNGDSSRMQSDIASLSRQGLVKQTSIMDSDLSPVRAVTLTKQGHRALPYSRFLRPDQVTYHGLKKPKEAFHDAELYRLYHKVSDEIEGRGGKFVRVKLDYEIKRDLYADLSRVWQDKSKCPEEMKEAVVVATHSGYFSTRQFLQFTGTKSGDKSMSFSQKLLGKGHATARSFLRNGLVYHLFSRMAYRAIGRENLRNRRAHSPEHIRTRLVALDFILAHLQYEYLETEDDKLNYFCQQLDIPKELLPRKRYSGATQNKTTERYFVDKFPMFLATRSFSPPGVTFTFVDPGLGSLDSFKTHLLAYGSLFEVLSEVRLVYISPRPT